MFCYAKIMKYIITINQEKVLELMPEAKIVDAVILDYIYWFCASPSVAIEEQRITGPDGLKYTWLNYDWMLSDLPLLGIRAKSALTPVFQRLEKRGFIKSYSPDNQRKFIAVLPKIDKLFTRMNSSVRKNEQSRSRRRTNHITKDQDTRNNMSGKPTDWNLQEELKKMCEDKRKHIRIVATWIEAKELRPDNKDQLQSIIKRNVRAAVLLAGYTNDDIAETVRVLKNTEYLKKYTLETVTKFIDEVVANREARGPKIIRWEQIEEDGRKVMKPIYEI